MLVDAVHMIAQREWQGGNQNVDGPVMRTSLTLCQETGFKRGSGDMLRSEVSCSCWRNMVSCTKGHVEKFLTNDDADD